MKKRIITMFVFTFLVMGSVSSVFALSIYGNITATNASATIDTRPQMHTMGFKGYYKCIDINGLTTTQNIDINAGSKVIYTKTWYAPTHYQSKILSVDALIDGRFAQLIEEKR